jgi:hypothetical protein
MAGLVVAAGLTGAHVTSRGRTRRVAARIDSLDPQEQAREVLWLLGTRDLAWDLEQALSLALFRTFAVPEVSVVLAGTGEFTARARKRFDDTELVLAEIGKHGPGQGRGRAALRRMNAMHAALGLDEADLVYVLSTFVVEPVRFTDRWGWRPMSAVERSASVAWYRELGAHMGLHDLPTTHAGFVAASAAYEQERFRFHPANRAVADATVTMFLDAQLPRALHGIGRVVVRALLDEPRLLAAFGYDPAPRVVVAAVDAALRSRAVVQRHLVPERRTPRDLTLVARPTYPDGYAVTDLGTVPDAAVRARVARHRADLAGLRP